MTSCNSTRQSVLFCRSEDNKQYFRFSKSYFNLSTRIKTFLSFFSSFFPLFYIFFCLLNWQFAFLPRYTRKLYVFNFKGSFQPHPVYERTPFLVLFTPLLCHRRQLNLIRKKNSLKRCEKWNEEMSKPGTSLWEHFYH